jgi:hypothetical protein
MEVVGLGVLKMDIIELQKYGTLHFYLLHGGLGYTWNVLVERRECWC